MFKNEQLQGERGKRVRRQITPPEGMFLHSDLSDGHTPIAHKGYASTLSATFLSGRFQDRPICVKMTKCMLILELFLSLKSRNPYMHASSVPSNLHLMWQLTFETKSKIQTKR